MCGDGGRFSPSIVEEERRGGAKCAGSIHHRSSIESVSIATSVQLSLRRRFHLSTSFIKSACRSIWQAYTLCTVDKIISSLWIWLVSSLTWAIATLIWEDKSSKKVCLEKGGGASRRHRARVPLVLKQCSGWDSISVLNRVGINEK